VLFILFCFSTYSLDLTGEVALHGRIEAVAGGQNAPILQGAAHQRRAIGQQRRVRAGSSGVCSSSTWRWGQQRQQWRGAEHQRATAISGP